MRDGLTFSDSNIMFLCLPLTDTFTSKITRNVNLSLICNTKNFRLSMGLQCVYPKSYTLFTFVLLS